MTEHTTPWGVFLSAASLSSFAGLASLLRSGAKLTVGTVFSAALNSGLLGLGIALLWYTKYQDNIYFLIGVCVLAGLGGTSMLDFVIAAFRRGGLTVSVGGLNLDNEVKDGGKS